MGLPVDGTSRSGLEAVLCSLIEPGTKCWSLSSDASGIYFTEIAERHGAELHLMECPWGEVFDQQAIIDEVKRVQPKILAIVHGETSTGCMQPLDQIGPACRELGVLTVVDAVVSIGGAPVKVDEWQLDAV